MLGENEMKEEQKEGERIKEGEDDYATITRVLFVEKETNLHGVANLVFNEKK